MQELAPGSHFGKLLCFLFQICFLYMFQCSRDNAGFFFLRIKVKLIKTKR